MARSTAPAKDWGGRGVCRIKGLGVVSDKVVWVRSCVVEGNVVVLRGDGGVFVFVCCCCDNRSGGSVRIVFVKDDAGMNANTNDTNCTVTDADIRVIVRVFEVRDNPQSLILSLEIALNR